MRLDDGREVTLRAIVAGDAAEIVQAFERLSPESRYLRFMQHKRDLDRRRLARGVHPRPGREAARVATVPASDGIDIVGAAQYVRAGEADDATCEFAVTVAEGWRGVGLGARLLRDVMRQARDDGYRTMEGWVIAQNVAMLALARRLGFATEPVPGDATVVRVRRAL